MLLSAVCLMVGCVPDWMFGLPTMTSFQCVSTPSCEHAAQHCMHDTAHGRQAARWLRHTAQVRWQREWFCVGLCRQTGASALHLAGRIDPIGSTSRSSIAMSPASRQTLPQTNPMLWHHRCAWCFLSLRHRCTPASCLVSTSLNMIEVFCVHAFLACEHQHQSSNVAMCQDHAACTAQVCEAAGVPARGWGTQQHCNTQYCDQPKCQVSLV